MIRKCVALLFVPCAVVVGYKATMLIWPHDPVVAIATAASFALAAFESVSRAINGQRLPKR